MDKDKEFLEWLKIEGVVNDSHFRKFMSITEDLVKVRVDAIHAIVCTKDHTPNMQVEGVEVLNISDSCQYYVEDLTGISGPTHKKWEALTRKIIELSGDGYEDNRLVAQALLAFKKFGLNNIVHIYKESDI